jgi:chromosome segregation ATPase
MKGHKNLQSLETCHDLQMVDGYVSLNGEQLEEIDNALGEIETEKALNKSHSDTIAQQLTEINDLTTERDNLTAERDELKPKAEQLEAKEAEIATLTQERDTLRQENAQKDARIKELEEALDNDPDNDPDNEEAMQAMHNGNHANSDGNFHEPTDEEAMESARKALGKN